MTGFLPYGRQSIDEDDITAVVEVLRGDYLTTGPAVSAFEAGLQQVMDSPHVVASANGTAALHLSLLALGVGPGDLCIVPSVTFLATANAARYVGADVLFCDVCPDTGIVRPQDLERALEEANGQRIAAFLPVHLGGHVADMETLSHLIADVAQERKPAIVEDACHALGSRYLSSEGEHTVGGCRFSEMANFSFHPVKTIASGEGGATSTRDPRLARKLAELRSHGMIRDPARYRNREAGFDGESANPWYYEMQEIGFNYRITDLQAALGSSQLKKLPFFIEKRRALVDRYVELLTDAGPIISANTGRPGSMPVQHLFTVNIDFNAAGRSRRKVMDDLREKGVGTQVHYIPVHLQPYYQDLYGKKDLPGAERYYARTLSLPLYPGMELADVDTVVDALRQALGLNA